MSTSRRLLFLDDLDAELEARWLEFWSNHQHAAWRQHPALGRLQQSIGSRVTYVIGFLEQKIALVGIFVFRPPNLFFGSAEVVCLRGPVFDNIDFALWCLPQVKTYFRSLGVGTARIGPYWRFPEAEALAKSLPAKGYVPLREAGAVGRRQTGIIDVRPPPEALLKSFAKSTRYEIRHADKLGVTHRIARQPAEAQEFFRHLDLRDKERGIERFSQAENEAIGSLLCSRSDLGAIIGAYYHSHFLGGLMIVRGGRTAYTSKFVVASESRNLFPSLRIAPSIFYQGLLWAKAETCDSVDLEGYSATDSGVSDLSFVNRYKAGFCPTPCETLGQYFSVCSPARHQFQAFLGFGQRLARLPRRLVYRAQFAFRKRMVAHRDGAQRNAL